MDAPTIPVPRDPAAEDARAVEALDALVHSYRHSLVRLCESRMLSHDEQRRILRHVDELAYRVRASALDLGLAGAEGVGHAVLHPRMVSKGANGRWPGAVEG